ncbi:outer membrane protein [Bartonella raoultii]|uniref:outer membrane protein n=1 Tax=Bartonella raoultii TaxID=1457020 RepID=UPI001ABBDF5E|nr:outer membrane protein [Bartonella raoultii]
MNTKFVTASVFTLLSSSIVQAADVVVEEPVHAASVAVVPPTFSWAGFYFGGQLGGFSSKASATTPDVDIPLFPDEEARSKPWIPVEKKYMPELSGFIGGLYAGINFDLGNNFILGVDTDILLTDRKDTKTVTKTPQEGASSKSAVGKPYSDESYEDGNEGSGEHVSEERTQFVGSRSNGIYRAGGEKESAVFSHTLKQKWTGATRVRVGFSTGRIMPYVAGGVAYGQFQDVMSISVTGGDPFNATSDVTKTMMGYTLGGGIDFAMTDNLIVRAEYRYSDFGKKKFKDEIEIKYKTNDFRAGIAYKF